MAQHAILTLSNVTWLLIAMTFVVIPHVARLPLWMTGCCIAAALWRAWIARKGLRTPPWWIMACFALGIVIFARIEYGRLFGREIGVALLIVMLCLKILEMKTRRDALLAIFLGFFLVATNFLYSQTIAMGAYMLICVWIFVATLIGFNRIGTEATLRERLVPAAWLLVQAIPLMLVIFLLFPRSIGPLWNIPSEAQASTGLSDSMSPGDISKLIQNDAVAFRAEFDGAIPNNAELYWRGPVLGIYNGQTWRMGSSIPLSTIPHQALSPATSYRVTLQAHNKTWLFALDMPNTLPENAYFTQDFQLRARQPVSSLRVYAMQSHLQYRVDPQLPPAALVRYREYFPGINPRTIAFAKKLRMEAADEKQFIDRVLRLYNTEFTYTLEPPALGANAMDEFLFNTKQGFCEHYAGSFALIMRAAGIPARVVTGYQGGELNPLTRQLVVRQSDAHAWTEIWLADLGWVRVDPTFAVSPLRINQGFTAAMGPVGVVNNLVAADKLGLLRQLQYSWDALNTEWNRWVVGFNADRQRDFLSRMGMQTVDWKNIAIWLGSALFGIVGITTLLLLGRLYTKRKDPLVAIYDRLCNKLAKAGFPRAPHEGPLDYLTRVARQQPGIARDLHDLIETYIALRYAKPAAAPTVFQTELRRLVQLERRFRPFKLV